MTSDRDLFRVREEIGRINADPFTDAATGDDEAGLTGRIGTDVVTVIRESVWRQVNARTLGGGYGFSFQTLPSQSTSPT